MEYPSKLVKYWRAVWTGWNYSRFPILKPAPWSGIVLLLLSLTAAACPPAIWPYQVQGATDRSPLEGQQVSVRGTVTFTDQQDTPQRNSLRGFFIQGPPSYQPNSSDGLFIYAPGHPVNRGDEVVVDGEVLEFHGLTELTRVRQVQRCGRAALPAPVMLGEPAERYEGMRVQLPASQIIDNYRLFPFGEIVVSDGTHQWTLEDGSNDRNLNYIPWGMTQDPALLANGRRLAPLTGVLSWRWNAWVILPDNPPTPTDSLHWRVPAPPQGSLRMVSWNVENLFNGDPEGFRQSRGARTQAEWLNQRRKIALNIQHIQGDLYALQEVEHDHGQPSAVLPELKDKLASVHNMTLRAIVPPVQRGDDAITQAFLYNPERLRPLGNLIQIPTTPRPSLAQIFEDHQGRTFGVINVHLKSRARCTDICAEERAAALEAILQWHRQQSDIPWFLVGDFNTLTQEPLWQPLLDSQWQRADLAAPTYWFRGRAQQLDHVWMKGVSPQPRTRVIEGHAEMPPTPLAHPLYNPERLWGASDHNPIVLDW
ncbi:endonuclease/exonuclease/phosphatase family protein [Salinispirillum sp. LH 10-3-1]|uniref:Endonuclease/exonuclease/phosphatase family protein n=1 Tax=Salinispirillum sp. LH 10-3-1 TaxID=2952525 RepID=A0AB38YEC0_9GAMM